MNKPIKQRSRPFEPKIPLEQKKTKNPNGKLHRIRDDKLQEIFQNKSNRAKSLNRKKNHAVATKLHPNSRTLVNRCDINKFV